MWCFYNFKKGIDSIIVCFVEFTTVLYIDSVLCGAVVWGSDVASSVGRNIGKLLTKCSGSYVLIL